MARQYVKVFHDWDESTSALTHEEKGRLIDALVAYSKGNPYTISGNERYVFPAFRLQIDRDVVAYEEISEKRKAAGAKGGKQKKANLANATNCEQTPGKSSHDHDHDHDHDQEENIFAASASRPDFNTIEAYASSNLQTLSPGNMEELATFKNELPDELIRHAIDEACAAGKRSWGYVRSILNRYISDGVKTVGETKARQKPPDPIIPIYDRDPDYFDNMYPL